MLEKETQFYRLLARRGTTPAGKGGPIYIIPRTNCPYGYCIRCHMLVRCTEDGQLRSHSDAMLGRSCLFETAGTPLLSARCPRTGCPFSVGELEVPVFNDPEFGPLLGGHPEPRLGYNCETSFTRLADGRRCITTVPIAERFYQRLWTTYDYPPGL